MDTCPRTDPSIIPFPINLFLGVLHFECVIFVCRSRSSVEIVPFSAIHLRDRFDWDEHKNILNQKKHGISFDEAKTVFEDETAILFDDPVHSEREERFLLLGMSKEANVCIVCHCYRESDTVIRIISARKATKKEKERYVRGI